MNIQIREYQEKDRISVLTLMEELQDFAVSLDPIKRTRRMPGYGEDTMVEMEESFSDYHGKCFIAFEDDHVVGYIWGLIAKQSGSNLLSVTPTTLGVIKDIYISEYYRGKKLGETLINTLESYFKENGCDSVWVDVFVPNKNAYEFYKIHGFVDRELGMVKKI